MSDEIEVLRRELADTRQELDAQTKRLTEGRAREAKLKAELQHRVRNVLAVVRSVFTRTMDTAETLDEAGMHFAGRLDVLRRYQLAGAPGLATAIDLEELIRSEFQSFSFGDAPGITIAGPPVTLEPAQAQPLALAIHELVTNSLKFGALATEGASLDITWSLADDTVQLVWAERGVAMVAAAPLRRGFGREFVEEALPYQIGAATEFVLKPGGAVCRLSLRQPSGTAQ